MVRFVGALSLVLAISVSGLLILSHEEPQESNEPRKPMAVPYLSVKPQSVNDVIVGYGLVRPRWETALTSEISGRVVWVSEAFQSGRQFAKGDVVVKLEPTRYMAALAQAEAELATARRVMREEAQRSQVAKKNWLASGFKGGPSEMVLRQPQLNEAEAAIRSAVAAVSNAKYELSRTHVTIPYDGIVMERTVNPGDYLRVGDPIGKIYDSSVLEVVLPLRPDQINRLDLDGASDEVILSDQAVSKTWRGRIARLEKTIDVQNRWRNLVIEIRHTEGILPGQFLTAEIPGKVYEYVVAVPDNMPSDAGTLWIINQDDLLQNVELGALFRKNGTAYFIAPHDLSYPLRVTTSRQAYLSGVRVEPIPEVDRDDRSQKVAVLPQ